MNVVREIEGEELAAGFVERLADAIRNWEVRVESAQSAAVRLAVVLPLKVETTLLFIINERLTKLEIKLQLDWIFSENP